MAGSATHHSLGTPYIVYSHYSDVIRKGGEGKEDEGDGRGRREREARSWRRERGVREGEGRGGMILTKSGRKEEGGGGKRRRKGKERREGRKKKRDDKRRRKGEKGGKKKRETIEEEEQDTKLPRPTISGSWAVRAARTVPGAASSCTVTWACERENAGGLSLRSRSLTETQAVSVWRASSQPPRPWGRGRRPCARGLVSYDYAHELCVHASTNISKKGVCALSSFLWLLT